MNKIETKDIIQFQFVKSTFVKKKYSKHKQSPMELVPGKAKIKNPTNPIKKKLRQTKKMKSSKDSTTVSI